MTKMNNQRAGLSLTEVLVALFVMALGMISLLTLFPVGAVSMGQSLRNDRCTELALQADGFMRAHWHQWVAGPGERAGSPDFPDPYVFAMDDPNQINKIGERFGDEPDVFQADYLPPGSRLPDGYEISTVPDQPVTPFDMAFSKYYEPQGPVQGDPPQPPQSYWVKTGARQAVKSYPVYLDPLGYLSRQGTPEQHWVARNSVPTDDVILIPRRSMRLIELAGGQPTSNALRLFSMQDSLPFETNGAPAGAFQRDDRYNWSAMIQRQNNDRFGVADLTIMVFFGRPPLVNLPGSELATIANYEGPRSVTVNLPNQNPNSPPIVRRGGWFMDGTINPQANIRNANFYRIVGLTELGTNQYAIDFEPPMPNPGPGVPMTLYFFEGLAEVFARPPLAPR